MDVRGSKHETEIETETETETELEIQSENTSANATNARETHIERARGYSDLAFLFSEVDRLAVWGNENWWSTFGYECWCWGW